MPQRPTSEELAALREELSSVDRALLEVVARRSRCVAEIAAFKAREDVPALDRARETDHLESMLARGAELLGGHVAGRSNEGARAREGHAR